MLSGGDHPGKRPELAEERSLRGEAEKIPELKKAKKELPDDREGKEGPRIRGRRRLGGRAELGKGPGTEEGKTVTDRPWNKIGSFQKKHVGEPGTERWGRGAAHPQEDHGRLGQGRAI